MGASERDAQEAAALVTVLVRAGYKARSYSGRGMYGKECVGVDLENVGQVVDAVLDVVDNLEADTAKGRATTRLVMQALRQPSEDSMGRGIILYWPRLPWPGART